MNKWIYTADEGDATMKDLLGGKGSNLCQMTKLGIPVPPVIVVTTEACNEYLAKGGAFPGGLKEQLTEGIKYLEGKMDRKFGDVADPLLFSVRSGAKISMPGMMDTVLNLGLNDANLNGLIEKSGNRRFALDCYRRLIQTFSDVALHIELDLFEEALGEMKDAKGIIADTDLDETDLQKLIVTYKEIVKSQYGDFPQDPREQLEMAIKAVFDSWNIPRAKSYRKFEGIPDDLGTAVNVQSMVFGNFGESSATGVAFSRNPSDGEKSVYGEYLVNAQGEDVVAGIRTPLKISEMEIQFPELYAQFANICNQLEEYYKDMQDIEFTIQDNILYILQTRNGKRTGASAVKIAVDQVKEGLITEKQALMRVDPISLNQLLHPSVDPIAEYDVLAKGLNASPGAAKGPIVFTPGDAVAARESGKPAILVRVQTTPDDIDGMVTAAGVLTSQGGMTSHAAVVARGMGKPCVAGCGAIDVNVNEGWFIVGGKTFNKGDVITIDGSSGLVIAGEVNLIEPEVTNEFAVLLQWADDTRRLKVRTNADDGPSSEKARGFGAEGIGLTRTEHMFMGERADVVAELIVTLTSRADVFKQVGEGLGKIGGVYKARAIRMKEFWAAGNTTEIVIELEKILAGDPGEQSDIVKLTLANLNKSMEQTNRIEIILAKLGELQKDDFIEIFSAMNGLPVTIRLIDPPLHEFIPSEEKIANKIAGLEKDGGKEEEIIQLRTLDELRGKLHEENPMLGLRGCRLGILYPEINRMQVKAILEAALEVEARNMKVLPEIMIPLAAHVNELTFMKELTTDVAKEVFEAAGKKIDYKFGTMIEIPRAALTASEIAGESEFFSFGTNDLSQMCYGISRDDAEKHFLQYFVDNKILPRNPFQVIDENGVGRLMEIAIEGGRKTRPDIKLGICGEHGGDPESIDFCHRAGLEYVSCSPYRVPVARLAAAQAVIREEEKTG